MTLRVAIVGLGNIGSRYPTCAGDSRKARTHIEAVKKVAGYELAAVCDADSDKREEFRQHWCMDVPVSKNVNEMMCYGPFDIVTVAVPTELQHQVMREILKYDVKTIFCEKPFCSRSSDEQEIIEMAASRSVDIAVNYHRRWDQRMVNLRQYLHEKGMPEYVEAVYRKGLYNYGSHIIDFLQSLFGEIVAVEAFMLGKEICRSMEPSVSGLLEFRSGLKGCMRGIDSVDYELIDFSFYYKQSKVDIEMGGCSIRFFEPRKDLVYDGYVNLVEVESGFKNEPVYGLVEAYEYIGECIRKDRKIENGNVTDALRVMKVLEALSRSLAEKKRVSV
jgi:predicted dehydrogenase